jgi:hypothetical protein
MLRQRKEGELRGIVRVLYGLQTRPLSKKTPIIIPKERTIQHADAFENTYL